MKNLYVKGYLNKINELVIQRKINELIGKKKSQWLKIYKCYKTMSVTSLFVLNSYSLKIVVVVVSFINVNISSLFCFSSRHGTFLV